jgi:ISXO2-like transposase domain
MQFSPLSSAVAVPLASMRTAPLLRRSRPIVRANIAKETALMTDEARQYLEVGGEFASHESVNHGQEEYVRGHVHTTFHLSVWIRRGR